MNSDKWLTPVWAWRLLAGLPADGEVLAQAFKVGFFFLVRRVVFNGLFLLFELFVELL